MLAAIVSVVIVGAFAAAVLGLLPQVACRSSLFKGILAMLCGFFKTSRDPDWRS